MASSWPSTWAFPGLSKVGNGARGAFPSSWTWWLRRSTVDAGVDAGGVFSPLSANLATESYCRGKKKRREMGNGVAAEDGGEGNPRTREARTSTYKGGTSTFVLTAVAQGVDGVR